MLTAKRLRELLDYDPATGQFWWRVSRGGWAASRAPGRLMRDGYRRIGVDGQQYAAHRLAWLYVNGEMPETPLDHKNGQRDDNRISNLRLASQSQNIANAKISARNSSGFKGVSKIARNGLWMASIKVNGKSRNLGQFATPEAAHAAYMNAASTIFNEFARAA